MGQDGGLGPPGSMEYRILSQVVECTNRDERGESMMIRICFVQAAAFAMIGFVGGCESGGRTRGSFGNPRDSNAVVAIRESPQLCRSCITLDTVAVLGDADGQGYVEYTTRVVQDSLGRFWINQKDRVKVFEASGRFVGEVGRVGRGPFEFTLPYPANADVAGNVQILDPGNQRLTVVSPDFTLVSEAPIIGPNIFDFVPLQDSGTYLLNTWLPTPDAIGHPFHVARGRDVLVSFGAVATPGHQDPQKARRILAVDTFGRVFSAKMVEYEIDVWTSGGRRIVGFSGPKLNQREVRPGAFNLEDNPIPSAIIDIQPDTDARLWVILRIPKEDWRRHVEKHVYRNGFVGLRTRPGSTEDSLFSYRLDVIDLASGSLVARRESEEHLTGFIGPGLLFENNAGRDDVPHVRVFRAGLKGSAQ